MDADDIELIYELSPLQQAMLFHGLVAPGSGAYVMQESLRLTGALDAAAFERAWRHVVARHGALRTAFFWEDLEKPVQVVFRRAEVAVARESWRGADPAEQAARLASYLDAELARGFDLAAPPLTRLALFELADGVHQFVWTQHHIVIDGWSRGLLLQELFACYRAFVDGAEPSLEPAGLEPAGLEPAGSYGAYVDWLQRREPGDAEAYWRNALAGLIEPTRIARGDGGGEGAPAVQPHFQDSRQRGRGLSAAATAGLREVARRRHLTLNTLVQGAWALVLARSLGSEDVVFGATVAGRPEDLPGGESTVGLFINTLPLRVAVPPERRLGPWLAELQGRNVELRRHEHTPLVDVQRWSGLPAGAALFDHLLAFENAPLDRELSRLVPELAVAAAAARNLTNYPLNLLVFPAAELWLEIVYDRRRVEAVEAARLLERLAGLLAAFAADPDLPLAELPLLLPGERQQVLAEWAEGAGAETGGLGAGALLHELFARQAARSPHAVAVALGGERWTYGRLLGNGRLLARHLRQIGVGAGAVVALAAERSPAMVVGMLAALEAGGAYLPLDPGYPADRLAFMLADSGARVLLAQEALLDRLPAADLRVVVLDERWEGEDGVDPGAPLDAPAAPDDLAYVIYTSGSTGRPKGVMVPHRGAVNYLTWCLGAYGLTPGAAALVHSPLGFDLTVTALWGPLLAGGRVELVPEREGIDGLAAGLAAGLAGSAFALVKLTPTHLELLSHQVAAGSLAGRVGTLVIGGEALFAESLAPWRRHAPATRLINEYGPTETVVGCAVHEVSAADAPAGAVPIGRPLAGSRLYVVDRALRPLPIGAPGELVVGGPGVTRGYLGRPDLTAERYVPDPFGLLVGQPPGGRLYRTGDLARWSEAGRLDYLGRIDSQVKVRGHRIEPGEIEAVLAAHPGVRKCAVAVRRDPPGDARLAAYVVPRDGVAPDERAWREHVARSLPEPMRPASYRILAALPLSPNGKLDRAALPAPEEGPRPADDAHVAPRDPLEGVLAGIWEEVLAGIWEEVLGCRGVGAHDDFFALGGHSLLATRVASRVRSVLAVEIPVRRVFEARTVAALARAVREEQEERQGEKGLLPPLIVPVPRGGDLPLSFAQQRLWFIDRLAPGSAAYNLASAFQVSGPLDAGALAGALTALVGRHEALRTTFARGASGPLQAIGEPAAVSLPVVDLAGLAALRRPGLIDIEAEVERLRAAEAGRPFDLARGPLLRTVLLRLGRADHAVLFTLHHIVGDGWSNGVLVHELTALYEAGREGRPSPLPPLPIQYADYAAWQRRWLAGAAGHAGAAQLAYWREALAGAPPVLDLPTDRPRPPVQSFRGSSAPFLLPAELSEALRALARREGATPFMVLLAGFEALLARASGQLDFCVGLPIAGRNRLELEGLIGFFVNTLVLRSELAGDPGFGEQLARARRTLLAAHAHQDLPFDLLVEALHPQRSLSHEPLFQVMANYQHALPSPAARPGLAWCSIAPRQEVVHFDLVLTGQELDPRDPRLGGRLEYRTDLFDATTARRLLGHLETLLAAAAADPELGLAELPLLAVAERHQLLVEGGDAGGPFAAGCLHRRFEAQARRRPAAPAVGMGMEMAEEVLAYGELESRANRLARRLQGLGVGPETIVGICLERSPALAVAMLAVLKAGGAYLPLDPAYPPERLAFLLRDAAAPAVVTEGRLRERLPAAGAALVCLDEEDLSGFADGPVASAVAPDNLAYVIYTSGSTGEPRGVPVSHANVSRLLVATEAWFGFGERDVWTLFHSFAFDFSVWEMWGALAYGGRLAVVPYAVSRSPEAFHQLLIEEGVTVLNQTPSAFRQLIAADASAHSSPPLALRLVIFGGEALDLPGLAPWVARHGARQPLLVNMYGITETTVHVTYRPLAAADVLQPAGSAGGSWIGRPLPDLTLRLLGPGLAPQPLGIPGELCVGGAGLARGYLGRPELTAARFVPDPWGAPGARLYRSGDLARRRWDGDVEYLGRIDHQVKIRGFRIELGEIEAALAAQPGVREAVVLVREHGADDRRLEAYVVGETSGMPGLPATGELREALQRRLPAHMVPAAFFALESLPLTVNGKVDRKALPALAASREAAEAAEVNGYVAPRGPVEEILAAIWTEVLGAPRVGAADDFFALGGHSLLAMGVVARIADAFGVELPVRRLFEGPTLAELARSVEEVRREGAAAEGAAIPLMPPPILPVPRDGELPLSFAQQRLWLVDQLQPGSPAYNVPWAADLEGDVDAERLRQTFGEVARRHEVLRTTFASTPRGAVQVVAPSSSVSLPVVSLAGLPAGRRETEVRRLASAEARRPFDLAAGPLLRVALLGLGGGAHRLLVTVHHVVADAWSLGVMLREVRTIYGALARGAAWALPELPVQYADYAVWQRRWLEGEVLERQLAYWRRELAGAPRRLALPTDRPRPAAPGHRGGTVEIALPPGLSRQLAAQARQAGATPFMALLAAVGALLGRWAGQDDLLLGTPAANRGRREIEGLIGFFVNTLVLRVDLRGAEQESPSFRRVLERARRMALDAFAHQDVPFERLVDELDADRDPRRSPLFQVLLALQTAPEEALALPGIASRAVPVATQAAKFELTFGFGMVGGELRGALEYRRDLFDETTVRRLAAHLETLLAGALADADRPLAELPLLAPAERHQVLREWAAASEPVSREVENESLAGRFEAQARRAPAACAVSCGDAELSYGELDRRANQLAHRLRELGVGPEARVGLCVERSLDLVIGVLGILKAGGAYVPIDPGYPQERRSFLLADCGARVVVGTERALADLAPRGTPDVLSVLCVLLDAEAADLARRPGDAPPRCSGGDHLAYVIYTSGSTGRPKGALVTHANVVRLFAATRPRLPFGPDDVWSLFHSYAFDFSVWELWGALLHGGRLVVVPYLVSRAPEAFLELLARERVTVLNQTPSAFYQLMGAEADAGAAGDLPDLRLVIFGGEALEPVRLAPWFRRHGDRRPRLVNMYGITETTVHVTYRPLREADAQSGRGSRIGIPLPDLAAHVLDRAFQPSPIGVPGELAIGGAGLARGYLGRPELTAERFVPDPFSGAPGARLYRSGDLARSLPSAELEYLGRIDHQIKVRGFRIELDEIQLVLAGHPGVREAIVLARSGDPGDPGEPGAGDLRLIAYVVPRPQPQASPSVAELRALLAGKLPEYMVPAAFVLLEALPLTDHGKVDRRALLALSTARREESQGYQPPRNEAEGGLVEIWEQVLGLDRVGIDDRFFSLGGDSILSLRVRALAAERGLCFTLQQLLEHQTVRELACRLESPPESPGNALAAAPGSAGLPFGLLAPGDREALPAGLEDAYPLTALQTGMLFHSAYTESSTLYHNVSGFRLAGAFDEGALRGAIERLLARHPVLRTSFDLSRFGEPLQLVHREVPAPLAVEDLRGLAEAEQEDRVAAAFAAEQGERLDVAVPPLMRFRVHLLGDDRFHLTWTEHHAILDGWSVAAMLAELFELYRSLRGAGSPPAAPPAATFRHFVALERETVRGEEGLRYWTEKLAGAPPLRLPRRPASREPGPPAPRIREVSRLLSPALTAGLRQLARSAGAPLKSVLLAAHYRALASATGEADLVSGLVVNGRPEVPDGERVLGLFLNTLPLRLRLPGGTAGGTWLDLVREAFAAERELSPFRRFPMAELQRTLGGGPLFETAFNFVHFHVLDGIAGGDLQVLSARAFAQTNFPFTASFAVVLAGSQLALALEFDEAVHGREQVEALAERYLRVLEELAAHPTARYDAGDFLADAERQQLLVEWNDSAAGTPDGTVPERFDRTAEAAPDAVAVVAEDFSLTYGELRRRASRLARHLRSLGVGPEAPVGLLLERSPELLVGLLGILEAGGAYVPMDPGAPAARLAFVVEDSGMLAVVTESGLAGKLAEALAAGGIATVLVDRWEEIALPGSEAPAAGVTAGDLAYVIYTSGSTGTPKGVLVEHGALVHYAEDHARSCGLTAADRGLQFAPVHFDASVEEIFPPLLRGAALVLRDEGMLGSPQRFLAALEEQAVTVLTLPTAYWHELVPALAAGPARWPAAARRLVLGGETVHPEHLARWLALGLAGVELVNSYGPTETTVVCTRAPLERPALQEVAIGRPAAGARIYLLGAGLHPVAAGAVGEIFIGGAGVARGYLGRPDLTAERFLLDPFGGGRGARLYRTGDLAIQTPDGTLEFRGRRDDQVKVRGFRVEPGEVELALLRHPGVAQAAVVAQRDPRGEDALVAYVVTAGEPPPGAAELDAYLRRELPAYMVPAALVPLERLPLTASDKVDRRALPAPDWTRRDPQRELTAPRDALEARLVEMWEELLRVQPIGVRDDFFALGGHSLLAVQLMGRIHDQLGRSLPIATLVRQPTVERLAAVLRDGAEPARRTALVEIEAGPGPDRVQQRAFFCVHPIGGEVLCYVPLARRLAADCAFYGLQALDPENGAESTVEAMAARYLASLKTVQPAGPYALGGWSMGGVVAFEIARQLEAAGESVDLLALIDAAAPDLAVQAPPVEGGALVALFAFDLARLFHLELLELPADFGSLPADEALRRLTAQAESAGALPPGLDGAELARRFALFAANHQAAARYVGGPCAAPVTLFKAAEPPSAARLDPDLGWGRLLGRPIAVREIAGDHYSLLQEPQVQILAASLRELIVESAAGEMEVELSRAT